MKSRSRVRIKAPHDLAHGKVGTVTELREFTATIKMDDGRVMVFGRSCLVEI